MDRSEILQKLSAGEISTDEAIRLLDEARATGNAQPEMQEQPEARANTEPEPVVDLSTAQGESQDQAAGAVSNPRSRWLHVRVTDTASRRDHVRINIPIGIVQAGMRFGSRFGHGLVGDAWHDVMEAVREGFTGTLVEVEDIEKGERVHIYVD